MAGVALSHGINPNIVHRWRRESTGAVLTPAQAPFVPVSLSAPAAAAQDICVDIRRSQASVSVSVRWPLARAGQCVVRLRELLK